MLDQMMILAADQSVKNYEALDGVSKNLANYNTSGYRAERFEQYIRPDGNTDFIKRTDYRPAPSLSTNRELDIAIDGSGFIRVTQPDGKIAYTRNGSFRKNAEGFVVTAHGDLVGTGIQIPATYHEVRFLPNGKVMLYEKAGQPGKEIGEVPIVNFPNPEGLRTLGNNLVEETTDSGAPVEVADHRLIKQGRLEESNVNVHMAVVDILRLNAGVVTNLRVVKAIDDIYQQAVNLRQ
jgi:flagellar basal-body rod protein FlgG